MYIENFGLNRLPYVLSRVIRNNFSVALEKLGILCKEDDRFLSVYKKLQELEIEFNNINID